MAEDKDDGKSQGCLRLILLNRGKVEDKARFNPCTVVDVCFFDRKDVQSAEKDGQSYLSRSSLSFPNAQLNLALKKLH